MYSHTYLFLSIKFKGLVIIYGMGWAGGYTTGGTEKSENIKGGTLILTISKGGHHFGKTISQIL